MLTKIEVISSPKFSVTSSIVASACGSICWLMPSFFFLWTQCCVHTLDCYYRDSFMDKVLDYIESDKEATEKFLKWFYPDYKEG